MGNFKDLEYEFIERTLQLIAQYEGTLHKYPFAEQFNHTLLINCLLGLIVMPKERTVSFIPNARLTRELRREMGIPSSYINEEITDLKELILALRHSIAHFDINILSLNAHFLIDEISFMDREKGNQYQVVRFDSNELLSFVRYYGTWLMKNIKENKGAKHPGD